MNEEVKIGFDGLTNMKADEVKTEAPKTRKWHDLFEDRKEE